jgi:hypothetical protein
MIEPQWRLNLLPRLRFFLRHGRWCDHPDHTEWTLVDLGRHKIRWCTECGRPEFV